MEESSKDRSEKVQTYPRIWHMIDWNGETEII